MGRLQAQEHEGFLQVLTHGASQQRWPARRRGEEMCGRARSGWPWARGAQKAPWAHRGRLWRQLWECRCFLHEKEMLWSECGNSVADAWLPEVTWLLCENGWKGSGVYWTVATGVHVGDKGGPWDASRDRDRWTRVGQMCAREAFSVECVGDVRARCPWPQASIVSCVYVVPVPGWDTA